MHFWKLNVDTKTLEPTNAVITTVPESWHPILIMSSNPSTSYFWMGEWREKFLPDAGRAFTSKLTKVSVDGATMSEPDECAFPIAHSAEENSDTLLVKECDNTHAVLTYTSGTKTRRPIDGQCIPTVFEEETALTFACLVEDVLHFYRATATSLDRLGTLSTAADTTTTPIKANPPTALAYDAQTNTISICNPSKCTTIIHIETYPPAATATSDELMLADFSDAGIQLTRHTLK